MADVTVANTSPGIAGKTLACHDASGTTTAPWNFTAPIALTGPAPASQGWSVGVQSNGNLQFTAPPNPVLILGPGGDAVVVNGIYERGRPARLGEWLDVPFNAAHFSATGGGTWTVAAGNIVSNRYTLIGKTLIWSLNFNPAGTIAGAVTALALTLPGGLAAAAAGSATRVGQIYDSGAPVEAIAFAPTGGPTIAIQKNNNAAWTPGALPVLLATLALEIQ